MLLNHVWPSRNMIIMKINLCCIINEHNMSTMSSYYAYDIAYDFQMFSIYLKFNIIYFLSEKIIRMTNNDNENAIIPCQGFLKTTRIDLVLKIKYVVKVCFASSGMNVMNSFVMYIS